MKRSDIRNNRDPLKKLFGRKKLEKKNDIPLFEATILDAEGNVITCHTKPISRTHLINDHATKKMATGAQGNKLRVSFSYTVRTQEMLPTTPDYLSRSFITVIHRRL